MGSNASNPKERYMPQGPLSLHLFEWAAAGLRPLEWKQRLSIALDVTRGVEYLHSLAQTSFIHRDLKPSNILLGDDMRAKVSDFELVKLAPDRKFSVETRLAGTFGYLAPEYAGTHGITPFHSIALDVARGVEYLHSLAQTSFIHRDLKPSNILLGDDMTAKVSDFELVKLAPDGKFSVETRLAGTFGYLAPEYAVVEEEKEERPV